jgi:competence protein ComEA
VIKDDDTNDEEEDDLCYVDVKGAVVNPGVYAIESNKRVEDAIKLAGGIREDGDTSLINLAKAVWDEMVIVVYTKDEVVQNNQTNTINTSANDAYTSSNDSSAVSSSNSDQSSSIININTASIDELKTLSGIGESKAQAIIDYREENGNFSSIEDIMNVSGIGQSIYEKIKKYITV